MPEVDIKIGGRVFQVACQEGEEHFLHSAAALLDTEAAVLAESLGRVPEERMLLMAGLMLADKTAGLDEELRLAEQRLAEQTELTRLADAARDTAENREVPVVAPEQVEVRVEVPVIAPQVLESYQRITDRAEALASQVESAAAG